MFWCCAAFAYATMIHAIPDHVYVQEGQKLELDKKFRSHWQCPQNRNPLWHRSGERTFQAMKQERAVETCSQLKQGGIYTDLLSVWHPSHERGAGFRGERKIFYT